MKKFWNFRKTVNEEEEPGRILEMYGTIAESSWYGDEVTPQIFREELFSGSGPVTLWLNSPGGDCIAASQIYTMLMDYPGSITVKIDGLAASAASVIAMAGSTVLMSPTAMLMVHNPMTEAFGDSDEMKKAMDMLSEVKESIINAYEIKTGLPRQKISHMMDSETWMNAVKAMELGFADGMIEDTKKPSVITAGVEFSQKSADSILYNKIMPGKKKYEEPEVIPAPSGRSYDMLMDRLNLIKN